MLFVEIGLKKVLRNLYGRGYTDQHEVKNSEFLVTLVAHLTQSKCCRLIQCTICTVGCVRLALYYRFLGGCAASETARFLIS